MMTKEQIFEEFKVAKEKDIAKSTTNPPYENVFTNRLNLLKSHRDAKKSNPKSYRHLDINFDNLNYKQFRVMSLEGKIIKKETITKNSYKINFSDKPDGIYIFLAESENKKSPSKILRKERYVKEMKGLKH